MDSGFGKNLQVFVWDIYLEVSPYLHTLVNSVPLKKQKQKHALHNRTCLLTETEECAGSLLDLQGLLPAIWSLNAVGFPERRVRHLF